MKKMSFSKCHSWCSQPIYVASKCHSLVYQTLNFIVLSYREFIVWWMDRIIVKIGKSGAVCKQYCHELRGTTTWPEVSNSDIWLECDDSWQQLMDFTLVLFLPSVMDYPHYVTLIEFNWTLKEKWHWKCFIQYSLTSLQ